MHNNFYFLRQLSQSLETLLASAVVSECFTQNKEELIVRLETHSGSFYIKASLLPGFSCLTFPETFHRAKKNSVDLFEPILGQRVANIRQFNNERSFAVTLSNNLALLFKMHGNRSNVLLFENDNCIDLFKKSSGTDKALKLTELDRVIDWSFENFKNNQDKLSTIYFTFGKVVWYYLENQNFSEKTLEEKWNAIQQVRTELEHPEFYITEIKQGPALSLLKIGLVQRTWTEPLKACNDFYYTYTSTFDLKKEKNALLSDLYSRLHNGKNYETKTFGKLQEVLNNNNYKVWADLIMANLHVIKPGSERITVQNFYQDNQPVEIKLKRDLSAQKNAEILYKKAKNQHLEIERLEQALEIKRAEISSLENKIAEAELLVDKMAIGKMRAQLVSGGESDKDKEPLPYHEFEEQGFRIWVGKNARSNDVLTLKLAHKEDLWLHAKDVSGSHVLIKHQAGKKFPKNVIERAAQLAAYNSKRKTDTLAPVVFTPKKYVRKRKGDPAGTVVVEREEVIMVEPKL